MLLLSNRQQIANIVKLANFVADIVKLAMDYQNCNLLMIWLNCDMNKQMMPEVALLMPT